MTSRPLEHCDLLIRNGIVVTVDKNRTIFPHGAVAVKDGRIAWVGANRDAESIEASVETIDARGALVHPGFIEPHTHASLHSTRGAMSDAPGSGPSPFRLWYNAIREDEEYASGLHCALELLKNGFTAFMDPGSVFEPDTVATAATEVGIRSSVADPFVWDLDNDQLPLARAPATRERAFQVLGQQLKRNSDSAALSRGHVALYGMATASDALMAEASALARRSGVTLTIHQSFMKSDASRDDARFGRHPLVHYAETGTLGEHCSFAHMNILRDDEIDAVVASRMTVIWQPGNYQYYAVSSESPCRMPELIGCGASLTLCADVAKMWTFGDMALVGYLSARNSGGYVPVERFFEMQTIDAARAIGREKDLGSLEPGKLADIVIRSNDFGEAQPGFDPIRDAILTARAKTVWTVIVNGRPTLRAGRAVNVDEDRVWHLSHDTARALVQRLGLRPGSVWPLADQHGS